MGKAIAFAVNGNYYVLPLTVISANIFDKRNTSVDLGDVESILNDFAVLAKENLKLKESLDASTGVAVSNQKYHVGKLVGFFNGKIKMTWDSIEVYTESDGVYTRVKIPQVAILHAIIKLAEAKEEKQ